MKPCPICQFDPIHVIADEGPVAACFYQPDALRPGHVLVYPKAHREGLSGLTPEEAGALMVLANRLAKAVEEETGAYKCYPVAIGDVNPHFHLHLLPKMEGEDSLVPFVVGPEGWVKGKINKLDPEAAKAHVLALRKRLNG